MRVFVTGASGFVGKTVTELLLRRGHEVIALIRNGDLPPHPHLSLIRGELGDAKAEWFGGRGIDVAIHSAWVATPGEYLNSPANGDFVRWSTDLLPVLKEVGVSRFVGVGTCLECPPSDERVSEQLFYLGFLPHSPYATAKVEWLGVLSEWAEAEGVSLAWARLFFPYGVGEHPDRLPSFLIRQLSAGKDVVLKTPASIKDYIYISDVAEALCALAETTETGAFHIGGGTGSSIESVARQLAARLGTDPGLVKIPPVSEQSPDRYPYQVADPAGLRRIGWSPKVSIHEGLELLISNTTELCA